MSAIWRASDPTQKQEAKPQTTVACRSAFRGGTLTDHELGFGYLVQGFGSGALPQPLDLVLDHQFPALQLDNLQVVRGKVYQSLVQFVFEDLVFPF
jgi:hypothetical protein